MPLKIDVEDFTLKETLSVLVFSDTHGCFSVYYSKNYCETLKNRSLDAVFLLGDLWSDDLQLIKSYFSDIPIYAVCGNHDFPEYYERMNVPEIHGRSITIKDYRIVGWHGSYKYKDSIPCCYSQQESLSIEPDIPAGDILISHDCPFGMMTGVSLSSSHPGLEGIRQYLLNGKASLHLFGHIHEDGAACFTNKILSLCVYTGAYIQIVNGTVTFTSLDEIPS